MSGWLAKNYIMANLQKLQISLFQPIYKLEQFWGHFWTLRNIDSSPGPGKYMHKWMELPRDTAGTLDSYKKVGHFPASRPLFFEWITFFPPTSPLIALFVFKVQVSELLLSVALAQV